MNRWTSVLLAVGGLIAFPLVDSAIKGTLILVLAAAVCLWLRRDSAATRHFVWTIAIGLLVAMPVLSLVLPQWRILPGWMNSEPVTLQQISLPTLPSEAILVEPDAVDEPAQPIAFERLPVDISGDASDAFNFPVPLTESRPSDAVSAIGPVEEAATTLPAWISVTWLIGCALLLVRLSIAAMMLRRSERRCVRLNGERQGVSPPSRIPSDGELPQLDESGPNPRLAPCGSRSEDARETRRADALPLAVSRGESQRLIAALEQSKLALGLKRPVAVLLDPKRSIPIVWGLWKTRLQLPKEALQWNNEQLQSVLLHELAHVRRRDLFVLALTQIACALHWFNPLVWIAAWRLHVERERACDDLVLNTGIRASSYAEHLLNVATRLTTSQWTQACGLAMARSSSLHGRLSAVLSEKQNRRSVTLAMTIMTLSCSLLVGIPMSMLRGADEVVQETPASQLIGETKPEETMADGRRVEANSDRTDPATVDEADDVVTVTWDHIDLHKIFGVETLPKDLANVLPESIRQLDGKQVRLRGYMYPTFEATGLTKFVISRDNAAMMLSHSPLLDQIVNVHLSADTDTNYIEGRPFDVEGIFRVKPAFDGNQKLSGLYLMEDAQIDLSLPGRKRTNRNRADSSPSRSPEVAAPEIGTFEGATIVAKVNGKPITVDDVLGGGRQIIEADSRLGENERDIVLRMAIQKRLQKYVNDELLMQEFERKIPKDKRDSIRESLEPRFIEFLETIKKDRGFKTNDELSAKLASEGNTISSLRDLFMRSQMSDGYLLSLVKESESFTHEELRKHYEENQSDYVIRKESDAANPRVTGITQPFDEVQKRVEQHLRRKLWEEGRAKALEEIRSRSTVEVFVDLKHYQDEEPKANAHPLKHPDAHAVLQDGNPERTSEEQAIVASLLASETERTLISLENSKVDLEAKRSANKEHAEAYSADELKLAELEVAEKEAVLQHAAAQEEEATLQKDAMGPAGDAKSLGEAKAAVRLAETNIASRRLATLELTQQLNQAVNQKTPGTYTSEEMEKLAVEIEKAKARIAELTGGPREKPQAAKAPGSQVEQQGDLRIATHPGLFEVGDRVFLWVARKLHPDPDENGASLVRVSKEGKQITTDIPLPPGEGTWVAGWVRGGQVLWVAQKGKTTRYDFSDAEQVQITDETPSSKGEAVPKELNALMQQAIGENPSKTDASQDALQGHSTKPASPDAPRASLDPTESPSRRTITWEDLAINATTLAEIRDERMALDEVSRSENAQRETHRSSGIHVSDV